MQVDKIIPIELTKEQAQEYAVKVAKERRVFRQGGKGYV